MKICWNIQNLINKYNNSRNMVTYVYKKIYTIEINKTLEHLCILQEKIQSKK